MRMRRRSSFTANARKRRPPIKANSPQPTSIGAWFQILLARLDDIRRKHANVERLADIGSEPTRTGKRTNFLRPRSPQ